MSAQLDVDDACSGNPQAERELAELRQAWRKLADMEACLPDEAYASKDWQQSGYPERIMWLRGRHEEQRACLDLVLEECLGRGIDWRMVLDSLTAEVQAALARAKTYQQRADACHEEASRKQETVAFMEANILKLVLRQGTVFGKAGNLKLEHEGTTYKTRRSERLTFAGDRNRVELDHPEWLEEPKLPCVSVSRAKAVFATLPEGERLRLCAEYGFNWDERTSLTY